MKWNKNFTNYIKFLAKELSLNINNLDRIYALFRCFDVILEINKTPWLSTDKIAERLGVQKFAVRNKIRELKKYLFLDIRYEKRTPIYNISGVSVNILKKYMYCGNCGKILKTKSVLLFVNKTLNIIKVFCKDGCRREWCNSDF